ncbi:hypothetical protein FRC12_016880 [Ceratobasidium sp. 428]|nr:hypothetical protein FRC12_016880 [Ceratobasidium sp. 428]
MPDPKDIVDSHLSKLSPARDVRPPTPEPTTEAGTTPNNALYDNPEPELTTGGRRRKSTERGDIYNADYARKEAIREKSNRTRARNTAMRARIAESEQGRDTSDQQASHDAPRPQPLPESRPRGRSRAIRELSRSPTPGSTDHEQEEPVQPPINKGNYIHEKLTYKGLAERAKEKYGIETISDYGSQALLEKIRVAEGEQAAKVGSSRRPASIVVRPGTPLKVGGGWHHEIPRSQPSRGKKRGSDASDDGPSKRARTTDCTTTESETEPDDDSGNGLARRAAERIANACPGMVVGADGSQPGTCPPPPSRTPTPEFVPATQYSQASTRSHSLGGSLSHYGESVPGESAPPEPVPPIPMLIGTSRGPVHHRLRQKALKRYFDRADRDAERADKEAGVQGEDEVDQLDPTDDEPDMSYVPGLSTQNTSSASRTYSGSRSHLPSQSGADTSIPPEHDDDVPPVERPNSPSLTPAELLRKERARAIVAKARAEMDADARRVLQREARVYAETTHPPTNRPQVRPEPGHLRMNGSGPSTRTTRRLDPQSAARADLIAFNEAVARGEATSFIESVTRQTETSARCTAPTSRPLHELLEDDEEMMAQAQAYAEGKLPSLSSSTPNTSLSSTSHGGRKKKKPLARDVSGIEREILSQAKVHFYVYALVQGIYQTRAAFLKWARAVYQATWEMELPMVPYVSVEDWIFEIMVNNLATLRGKAKELTRPFAADSGGFEHTMTNQQTIQNNLNRFNLLYPNNFHCRSYYPREGHFENPDVGRCIAVIVCSGPNAPARQYPDYVRDMCFNLVAFCMAIWQFCIGEWSHGWHQNGDLGMAAMREVYEGFLAQLKDLHSAAPRRMGRLRNSWREFCEEYSGLSFDRQQAVVTGSTYRLEMRPDTPTPEQPALDDSISVDEMNEQLFETARQASLDSRAQEIIAREELEDLDTVINEEEWEELYALDRQEWEEQQAAARRSPSPLPQYDEDGRLTTQSKGKGRAN